MQEMSMQEIDEVSGGLPPIWVGVLLTPVGPFAAGVVIGVAVVSAGAYLYYNR